MLISSGCYWERGRINGAKGIHLSICPCLHIVRLAIVSTKHFAKWLFSCVVDDEVGTHAMS